MLPTIQMHLIMCTTFSPTANKFEFLAMASHLIDRLTALAHLTYSLRPGHSSDLSSDFRLKFSNASSPCWSSWLRQSSSAHCLGVLLQPGRSPHPRHRLSSDPPSPCLPHPSTGSWNPLEMISLISPPRRESRCNFKHNQRFMNFWTSQVQCQGGVPDRIPRTLKAV